MPRLIATLESDWAMGLIFLAMIALLLWRLP